MATFKICVFSHQKRQDGKYPVSIRVYWKRKYGYIGTEHYVTDKQLQKKSKQVKNKETGLLESKQSVELKDIYIIDQLNKRILGYESLKSKQLGENIHLYTAQELAKYFEKETSTGSDPEIDFIRFARKHCEKLVRQDREQTAKILTRTINALIDFAGERIPVSSITSKFLDHFEAFLKGERVLKRKNQFGKIVTTKKSGISDVSLVDYMTDVRTLFNAAVKEFNDEDKGDIKIAHYPFKKYKIEKTPKSKNLNLSVDQIRAIAEVDEKGLLLPRTIIARDVFMLSFYLAGTNLIDLYETRAGGFKDGRFSYERHKTARRRKDNAYISVQVQPEALPLFEKYKDPTGERVFDFYRRYSTSHIFSSNINKGLKKVAEICGIDEPLTTYYARHSIATIARNDCNVSKDDINLLLNHVDEDMRVTDIYLAVDWSKLDNAVRKVLDLVGFGDLL